MKENIPKKKGYKKKKFKSLIIYFINLLKKEPLIENTQKNRNYKQ